MQTVPHAGKFVRVLSDCSTSIYLVYMYRCCCSCVSLLLSLLFDFLFFPHLPFFSCS
jgi:hypothetical protein